MIQPNVKAYGRKRNVSPLALMMWFERALPFNRKLATRCARGTVLSAQSADIFLHCCSNDTNLCTDVKRNHQE